MDSSPMLKLSRLRQVAWAPLAGLALATRGGPPPVHGLEHKDGMSGDFLLTGAALLCLLLLAVPCLLLVH